MFVDQAKIELIAGKGGDGAVNFRREKYVPDGGPDGGDGGRGGNVVAVADSGLRTLMDFRYKKRYVAPSGENGSKRRRSGKDGEDLEILLPVGTLIREAKTGGIIADMTENGQRVIIARGGKGGRGNWHFKTATRQAPTFSEQGRSGVEREVILELKMIADVGLIGYPNVGKSTILSQVTRANPKIANYHFTTLTPNLGVANPAGANSFVIADIPGLIEGAYEGVGLGHDFLRHIERTGMFIHVVDISGLEGRDPIEDVEKINNELFRYSDKLSSRLQVIAANKMDLLGQNADISEFTDKMNKKGYRVFPISAATSEGLNELMLYVAQMLDEIDIEPLYTEDEIFVEPEPSPLEWNYEKISYEDEDIYIVSGEIAERIVFSTNIENDESFRYFQKYLADNGVFDKLKQMGIKDGDIVQVADIEFEYYD